MANEHWFVRRKARTAGKKAKNNEQLVEELKPDKKDRWTARIGRFFGNLTGNGKNGTSKPATGAPSEEPSDESIPSPEPEPKSNVLFWVNVKEDRGGAVMEQVADVFMPAKMARGETSSSHGFNAAHYVFMEDLESYEEIANMCDHQKLADGKEVCEDVSNVRAPRVIGRCENGVARKNEDGLNVANLMENYQAIANTYDHQKLGLARKNEGGLNVGDLLVGYQARMYDQQMLADRRSELSWKVTKGGCAKIGEKRDENNRDKKRDKDDRDKKIGEKDRSETIDEKDRNENIDEKYQDEYADEEDRDEKIDKKDRSQKIDEKYRNENIDEIDQDEDVYEKDRGDKIDEKDQEENIEEKVRDEKKIDKKVRGDKIHEKDRNENIDHSSNDDIEEFDELVRALQQEYLDTRKKYRIVEEQKNNRSIRYQEDIDRLIRELKLNDLNDANEDRRRRSSRKKCENFDSWWRSLEINEELHL